jgi:hypothetical protein
MSFWNPEPSYPRFAKSVTFKAAGSQISRWTAAAKKYNRGSRGAFIAWAVDFACFALEARERADDEHHKEMHLWDRKLDE